MTAAANARRRRVSQLRLTAFLRRIRVVRDARREALEELGITKSRAADGPVWILALLLLLAGAVAIGAAVTHSLSSEVAIAAASGVITVAGLLVAVLQWRAGLAEKALDALYLRIALANKMRLAASDAAGSDDEAVMAEKENDNYRFFVYTEIDSLEYTTLRYRFGLGMTDFIADRAVRHFRRRCEASPQFLKTARWCVEEGAYFDDTKTVVNNILASAESRDTAHLGIADVLTDAPQREAASRQPAP